MPALPVVPDALKVVVEGTTPAYPWVNILHWGYAGSPPASGDCVTLAGVILTAWKAAFLPLMYDEATVDSVSVTDLSSYTGGAGVAAGSSVGTRGSAEVPGSSCVLVKKIIGRRYRGGHPRTYLCVGIQTDLNNVSQWSATLVGLVTTAYGDINTALSSYVAGPATLSSEVCVSYIDKTVNPVKPYRRTTPLVLPVTSYSVESQIAEQRRRIGR